MKITLSNSILSRIGMTNQTGCPREGGGGLLQILSDRNGRVGFEIFNSRIFLVQFGRYFLGWLDLSRDFWVFKRRRFVVY